MGGTVRISRMSFRWINLECWRDQATRLTVQVSGPSAGEGIRNSSGAWVKGVENEKEA